MSLRVLLTAVKLERELLLYSQLHHRSSLRVGVKVLQKQQNS